MEQKKFEAVLILLIPQLVQLITEKMEIDYQSATEMLYRSELYAHLEREETKLWHLSTMSLLMMLQEEVKFGTITFPEEV